MRDLIRVKPVELDATRRRLSVCHDIADLRATGRRLIVKGPLGPADCLHAVSAGADGVQLSNHGGRQLDRAVPPVQTIAAAREAVASATNTDLWFQLYLLRDRGLNKELVDRAAAAKYRVLVVTVDCFVTGHRTRDRRNGLVIPPELTARTLLSIASKPGYWTRMLRSPAIDFANFAGHEAVTIEGTGALFNPAITWDDIAELRARWPGRLVVKGPLGPEDAVRAVSVGADGVQLSNHGGRQLDRTVAPVTMISAVRDTVGPDISVLVDSGVRHGSDMVVALALGADACAIGRAYLYGLMAGGEAGVDKALDILAGQFKRTMQLLGVPSVAELRSLGSSLLVNGR